MEATSRRGALIVIEGLDRSGKSTQAAALLSRLKSSSVPAELIKFPDRTTQIGKMIDAYLRSKLELDDRVIHLLYSANRWELATNIERSLNEGKTIICDRYAFSGVAFSASKGLPLEWCRAPDIGLPAPILTLFLDVTPEKAKARGGYGEERYEKEEMQRHVREVFARLADEEQQRGEACTWVTIDAGRTFEEVEGDIWNRVDGVLNSDGSQPNRGLWVPSS